MLKKINGILKTSRINYMVQGSALNITIFLCIVIGVCMMLLVMTSRHVSSKVTKFAQDSQLQFNMISAYSIIGSSSLDNLYNGKWLCNYSNDDSLFIESSYWGAYKIAKIATKNRHEIVFETGLFGAFSMPDTGLVIEDRSRPVSFGGKVILKANCFVPRGEFAPSTIFGTAYVPTHQNNSFIKKSPFKYPAHSRQFLDGVAKQKTFDGINDSLVAELPREFCHSFKKQSVVWVTDQTSIRNHKISGNIRIFADILQIDSSTVLDDVVIVCNKIRFANSFTGTCHVIARDSIIIEDNCQLRYPSSLVLLTAGNKGSASAITLGENALIEGALIAITEGTDSESLIKLDSHCAVEGLIYTSGLLHLGGTINASVFAKKVLQYSQAAIVDNAIANCTIDPKKGKRLLVADVFNNNTGLELCKRYE